MREYSTLRPVGRKRWVALYFIGTTALHYLLTWILGYSPRLFLGLPTLYWLSIGIVVLYVIGVYALILRSTEGRAAREPPAVPARDDGCS